MKLKHKYVAGARGNAEYFRKFEEFEIFSLDQQIGIVRIHTVGNCDNLIQVLSYIFEDVLYMCFLSVLILCMGFEVHYMLICMCSYILYSVSAVRESEHDNSFFE